MAKKEGSKRTVAILLILAIALSVIGTYLAISQQSEPSSIGEGTVEAFVLEKENNVASAQVTAQVVKRNTKVVIE